MENAKRAQPEAVMKTNDFANDAEVQDLVSAFEAAAIAPAQFHHGAHIAVALHYLSLFPPGEAAARMRSALLHFTARHGVDVYHETVTTFWMRFLDHLAAERYRELPLWRRINLIAERYGTIGALEAHFSPAILQSKRARQQWVPPDRAPLPF